MMVLKIYSMRHSVGASRHECTHRRPRNDNRQSYGATRRLAAPMMIPDSVSKGTRVNSRSNIHYTRDRGLAGRAFRDGVQIESMEDVGAWKDYFGNYVMAPIGYKSYMIEDPAVQKGDKKEDEGKWVKFTPEVGPVGERRPKPFAFQTIMPGPSRLIMVKLPRPMGITFEMDSQGLTRVVGLVSDSRAQQAASIARLGAGPDNGSFAQVGDVLRAVTTTTLEWGNRTELTGDLTGTERLVVLFGADGQSWPKVQKALRSGLVADGDVELVLERQSTVAAASAVPTDGSKGSWRTLTDDELERRAAEDEERMFAAAKKEIPGTLDEASSFNIMAFGVAATTIGLFLAGFS